MRSFEANWVGRDGIRFFMQGWEPDTKPRAVLALIHGLGEHSGRYSHVGRILADAGYALAGFDLRGHGSSSGKRGHIPSLDSVLLDIEEFMAHVEARYPETPHLMYGHSLGGLLALAYAIQVGNGLTGVVVTGPALRSPLEEQRLKVLLVRLIGSIVPSLTLHSGLDVNMISRDPAVIAAYRTDPLVHMGASLGFGRCALNAIQLCFRRARELTLPLLIMHGTADRITTPAGSEEFARLVGEVNEEVTLQLWDGLYHELHNEPERDEVFAFMLEWLGHHTT